MTEIPLGWVQLTLGSVGDRDTREIRNRHVIFKADSVCAVFDLPDGRLVCVRTEDGDFEVEESYDEVVASVFSALDRGTSDD